MPAITWVPGEATVVAMLTLATELTKAGERFWEGASPEQKQQLVQWHLNNIAWWQSLLAKLGLDKLSN